MSEGKGGFTKLRHDLRTCVNQILGYSELLREEAEELQPDFVPDLDRIGSAGRRLLGILDGLFSDEGTFSDAPASDGPAVAAPPPATTIEQEPGRILVVDDDEANRDLLRKWLEMRGHQVLLAPGGKEALHLIENEELDLVLLDVMMPDISGLQVLMKIRETRGPSQLPVIMATARTESESIVAALSFGANDHIPKPLDLHVVLARVRSQISLKRAVEQNAALARQIELRNRFIRQMFGRYLSDEVVENLLETREGLSLGGERRRITILMTDLRGFSTLTERLAPEQVVGVINNFLGVMTEIIIDCGGTIDEFIGDAILVLFGAPFERDDHALAAARCALRMQNAMQEVGRINREQELPEVEMGIGIHTGEVVAGNIGSEKRMKYGVVGSAVNLASRIESYTVGGQILVSPDTWADLGDLARDRGTMAVTPKGYEDGLELHDLVALDGDDPIELALTSEELEDLSEPIEIDFTVLVGKETGGIVHHGYILRLSSRGAEVRCGIELKPWSNLRLRLGESDELAAAGDVYAKVTGGDEGGSGCYSLRFTSVAPGVSEYFRSVLGQKQPSK